MRRPVYILVVLTAEVAAQHPLWSVTRTNQDVGRRQPFSCQMLTLGVPLWWGGQRQNIAGLRLTPHARADRLTFHNRIASGSATGVDPVQLYPSLPCLPLLKCYSNNAGHTQTSSTVSTSSTDHIALRPDPCCCDATIFVSHSTTILTSFNCGRWTDQRQTKVCNIFKWPCCPSRRYHAVM